MKFPIKVQLRSTYDAAQKYEEILKGQIDWLSEGVRSITESLETQKAENADLHRRLGAMRCSNEDHQWSGGMVTYPEGRDATPSVAPRNCHWCGKEDEGYCEKVLEEHRNGGNL